MRVSANESAPAAATGGAVALLENHSNRHDTTDRGPLELDGNRPYLIVHDPDPGNHDRPKTFALPLDRPSTLELDTMLWYFAGLASHLPTKAANDLFAHFHFQLNRYLEEKKRFEPRHCSGYLSDESSSRPTSGLS